MSDKPVIAAYANVYNVSGTPCVFEHAGGCYFGLAEMTDPRCIPVSREFYDAFMAEFAGKTVAYSGKSIAVQTAASPALARTLEFAVIEPEQPGPGALSF